MRFLKATIHIDEVVLTGFSTVYYGTFGQFLMLHEETEIYLSRVYSPAHEFSHKHYQTFPVKKLNKTKFAWYNYLKSVSV